MVSGNYRHYIGIFFCTLHLFIEIIEIIFIIQNQFFVFSRCSTLTQTGLIIVCKYNMGLLKQEKGRLRNLICQNYVTTILVPGKLLVRLKKMLEQV